MLMAEDFKIRLTAKTEIVDYQDFGGHYRFDAYLKGDTWEVMLPPSHRDFGRPGYEWAHELTAEERRRILPRAEAGMHRDCAGPSPC